MKLRGLRYVLRCRPRERDALGGFVIGPSAFFSSSAFPLGFRELVPLRLVGKIEQDRPYINK